MVKNHKKASLLIPTLNAGKLWVEVLDSIGKQNYPFYRKMIVDSGSVDDTVKLAVEYGFEVLQISEEKFNHGATRQFLVDSAGAAICIFMTQDAILASEHSVQSLVSVFDDENIGITYGRQIAHDHAGPLEKHARLFNYPDRSQIRSLDDREKLGFKICFCSNSFAAYRKDALDRIGGFPVQDIMGEDTVVAGKMLLKGWKIAYVATAIVKHSHSYTWIEEFRRYFDTRVFHEQNRWLTERFGKPVGEGLKYVRSELKYVINNSPKNVISSLNSIFAKWLGYTAGKFYRIIPRTLLKHFSMHKSYWK